MKPEISVILPCYGAAAFLPRIADCLERQTFKNFEILLVNDGDSRQCEIMQQLAAKDEKIRIIDKENGGVSSARNAGIDAAQGNYIVFADPDDEVKPYYLQSLYDAIEKSNADIAVGGIDIFYLATNKTISRAIQYNTIQYNTIQSLSKQEFVDNVDAFLWCTVCNKITKADFFRENKLYFREGITQGEDTMFFMEIFTKSNPYFALIEHCGYVYLVRDEDNAVARYHANYAKQQYEFIPLQKEFVRQVAWSEDKKQHYLNSCLYDIGYNICMNCFSNASPLSFRQICKLIKSEIMPGWRVYHKEQNRNMMQKIYNFGMAIKSALLLTLAMKTLFMLKKLKYFLKKI
jgi:glycosyltransferase involved in cell wall biosynthesis